jgi:hypothetical protein
MPRNALAAALSLLTIAACTREAEHAAAPPAGTVGAPAAPVAPVSPRGGGLAMAPAGEAPASVTFQLPARFVAQTPSSSMRLAQAEIPGAAGPATLAIFFFGAGGGGGVEANFERWVSQVEVAPGRTPERHALEPQPPGLRVTWIEVAGTLLPTGMGGPAEPQPGAVLFGAVVEGEGGPWFVKVTGPETTIAAARVELLALLASFRPAPPPGARA